MGAIAKTGLSLLLLGLLPHVGAAVGVESFGYACNSQISPERSTVVFVSGAGWLGRLHVNDQAWLFSAEHSFYMGRFSQTADSVGNLSPSQYEEVFRDGWSIPHAALEFDFEDELQAIRAACLPAHRWAATLDSFPLTTLIRFDGPVYHAAQFSQAQVQGLDTFYTVPWTTQALPGADVPQLIWVQGVARVKGVVEGQVTLLASDSLFIMGDLLMADTILQPCQFSEPFPGTPFGTVPAGSPNRIGLIGERDVIVAATLENGFSNGEQWGPDCGMASDPVVSECFQDRKDVIITAAVLALGCSFEAEFWKTTAWGCDIPLVNNQLEPCGGYNNTHIMIWDTEPGGQWPDCPGANALSDWRGTVWLYGSLVAERAGFVKRSPVGPWGEAVIGYDNRMIRHDGNLDLSAPPFWPQASWILEDSLRTTWRLGAASACGDVDPALFLADWTSGALGLDIAAPGYSGLQDIAHGQVVVWVNGQPVDTTRFAADVNQPFHWVPDVDLQPFLQEEGELWLEVQQGDFWGESEPLETHHTWNAGGADCAWTWQATAVDPAAPAGFRLSEPWPNPFNPSCQVELSLPAPGWVTLEVFDLLGRREALPHDGALAAGSHIFTLDGSRWAAGLHLLRLQHPGGAETRKLLVLK